MGNIKIVNNLGKDVQVEVNDREITIAWAKANRKLSDLKTGDVFKDGNETEYIICEHFDNGTTAVVKKDLLETDMKFGTTNDWKDSDIREHLNGGYLKELKVWFGGENIVEFERDLTSLDGYDDYGKCQDKASVMSIIEYMKYHKYIGNCDRRYCLLTPDSTPSGRQSTPLYCGSDYVENVLSYGDICYSFHSDFVAVRPFFILKSNIFVF